MDMSIKSKLLNKNDFELSRKIEICSNDSYRNSVINIPLLDKSSDTTAYALFFFGSILIGISNFGIKFTSQQFPNEFSSNGFLSWRSFSVMLIAIFLIKRNNERLIKYHEIENKVWFILRTVCNYFSFLFLILCMMELRAATASCMSSMYPVFVLVFSIFLLKEKFYIRYIIGLIICIFGTLLIIMNERKINFDSDSVDIQLNTLSFIRIITGTFYGILHLLNLTCVVVGMKILATEKISNNEQCFYIGISNGLLSFTAALINDRISFNLLYILTIFFFSIMFYLANLLFIEAMKITNLSKLTPLSYINTLCVFFLGVIFCGEKIFYTDIIGSSMIVLFNIYNGAYPVK